MHPIPKVSYIRLGSPVQGEKNSFSPQAKGNLPKVNLLVVK